jgi:hypothetical protein
MSESRTDVKDFYKTWCTGINKRAVTVAKIAYIDGGPIERDGAKRLVLVNEYLNEAVVGLIITHYLGQKIPNIVCTRESWIQGATGFILQDYGGRSMLKNMADLSLAQFKSILVQMLVTLGISQSTLHFKHHDLHLENVFLTQVKEDALLEWPGAHQANKWTYPMKDSKGNVFYVTVTHSNILAKLGDFGLASITDIDTSTRYERVDYSLLDTGEQEWGSWNGTLENQKSYDAITFLSKFFLEHESGLCPKPLTEYAQTLYVSLREHIYKTSNVFVESTWIGRPFRGLEGPVAISDLFQCEMLKEFVSVEIPADTYVFQMSENQSLNTI